MDIAFFTSLFIGLNIDFFLVIVILMSKYSFKSVTLGYVLGVQFTYWISLLLGQSLQAVMPMWVIGFMGLIPIAMGILGSKENNDVDSVKSNKFDFLTVMIIFVAGCSADNLAAYIPILSTVDFKQGMIISIYFIFLTLMSAWAAKKFGSLPMIDKFFQKYSDIITRIVYILIGVIVIYSSGLLNHLLSLF